MVYIFGGVVANFLWGLAFLVPYILPDTAPGLIVFGRYFVYGLMSIVVMSCVSRPAVSRSHWRMAFILAFTGNVGYFLLMAMAVQMAGLVVATLIIGTLPVVMALYGNRIENTVPYGRLVLPLGLIAIGLLSINGLGLVQAETPQQFDTLVLGIVLACGALGLWTHYGVKNAHYLKVHQDIDAMQWVNVVGIASLIQVGLAMVVYVAIMGTAWIPTTSKALWPVIGLSLMMGVLVSWVATHLWNVASRHIPIVLVGQLIVFETISSLIYGHLVDQSLPSLMVLLSALTVIIGVVLSIRVIYKNKCIN